MPGVHYISSFETLKAKTITKLALGRRVKSKDHFADGTSRGPLSSNLS